MATIESLQSEMAALTMRITALESVQVTAQITKTKTKMTSPPKMAVEGQTTPDDYRLSSIDETLCQGRKLKPAGMDKRWAPTVYHESQCQGKPSTEGLCDGCHKLCEKETDLGTFKNWNGRVGEDLMDHVHMLGTAWSSKCVWKGGDVTVTVSAPAPKTASAEKEAKKAAKEAEKEAKKAAEKAEKEAKKAAEKAAKEAEKEAKKAEKAAEKAAKKSTEKVKEKGKGTAVMPALAVPEPPADGDHVLTMINGELRAVKNGNVYDLDELTQEPTDYLGRLTGTKEAPEIDGNADEVEESDAE